jgi:cell volume regulation protein A
MIKRNGKFVRPGGSTVIEANDTLVLLLDNEESLSEVNKILTKS